MEDKKLIEEKVVSLFEAVRPHFQSDGGDLYFIELTDDLIVKVQLLGACQGCAYQQTTITGLKEIIINEIPEVKDVVTV